MIRPCAVWYDDKNGGYTWYVDYMRPSGERKAIRKSDIKSVLGDGWALEDGQCYSFDVSMVQYYPYSDHFDKDHYDYYLKYGSNYITGSPRGESDNEEYFTTRQEVDDLHAKQQLIKDRSFLKMVESLDSLPFLKVMNSWNAQPEQLHRFSRRRIWTDILQDINWKKGNFFDAQLRLAVSDEEQFHNFIKKIPQDIGSHFDLAKAYIYMPGGRLIDDGPVYNLELSSVLDGSENELKARQSINAFFD